MTIHIKKVSVGAFLKKGQDIKDEDIITIASECREQEGQFGVQQVILVKTKDGKEGNIGINQTSINNLIDVYGENDINWIGKEVKVWLLKDFKDGKMILKMYLSHPEAEMTEKGFTIPEEAPIITKKKKSKFQEQLEADDIPIVEDEINVKKIKF